MKTTTGKNILIVLIILLTLPLNSCFSTHSVFEEERLDSQTEKKVGSPQINIAVGTLDSGVTEFKFTAFQKINIEKTIVKEYSKELDTKGKKEVKDWRNYFLYLAIPFTLVVASVPDAKENLPTALITYGAVGISILVAYIVSISGGESKEVKENAEQMIPDKEIIKNYNFTLSYGNQSKQYHTNEEGISKIKIKEEFYLSPKEKDIVLLVSSELLNKTIVVSQ